MRRSDRQALRVIRAHLAALGEPVDDMSDRRLRAAVVAVSGARRDALALTARMQNAAPRQDDAGATVHERPPSPPNPSTMGGRLRPRVPH
jgi:hypothetical protein